MNIVFCLRSLIKSGVKLLIFIALSLKNKEPMYRDHLIYEY